MTISEIVVTLEPLSQNCHHEARERMAGYPKPFPVKPWPEQICDLLDDLRGALGPKPCAIADQIESLARVALEAGKATAYPWDETLFTKLESRIVAHLYDNLGKVASRSAINEAAYFDDNTGGAMSRKTLDVFIFRIRQKLAQGNFPFKVETILGRGFRMNLIPNFEASRALKALEANQCPA